MQAQKLASIDAFRLVMNVKIDFSSKLIENKKIHPMENGWGTRGFQLLKVKWLQMRSL